VAHSDVGSVELPTRRGALGGFLITAIALLFDRVDPGGGVDGDARRRCQPAVVSTAICYSVASTDDRLP
jgi:hypothetical protein